MLAQRIVGTWRLIASEIRLSDGRRSEPLGSAPLGSLIYDGHGNMSAHLLRRERPRFQGGDLAGGTPEEVAQAFRGAICYFGTYEVCGDQVIHHVEGSLFPNWIGAALVRRAEFASDHLILTSSPTLFDGVEQVARLELARVSPC